MVSSEASETDGIFYDERAVALVTIGYDALKRTVGDLKKNHQIRLGVTLYEVVAARLPAVRVLLGPNELRQFQEYSGMYLVDDVLTAFWYILQNHCGELRMAPILAIDTESGCTYVGLKPSEA